MAKPSVFPIPVPAVTAVAEPEVSDQDCCRAVTIAEVWKSENIRAPPNFLLTASRTVSRSEMATSRGWPPLESGRAWPDGKQSLTLRTSASGDVSLGAPNLSLGCQAVPSIMENFLSTPGVVSLFWNSWRLPAVRTISATLVMWWSAPSLGNLSMCLSSLSDIMPISSWSLVDRSSLSAPGV